MNEFTNHHHAWQSSPSLAERLKPWAIALLIVLAYGIVGRMDHEDTVAMDAYYAEMVCAGHWPDYDGRKPACQKVQIATSNH